MKDSQYIDMYLSLTNINYMHLLVDTIVQCTMVKDTVLHVHKLTPRLHPVLWDAHYHIDH